MSDIASKFIRTYFTRAFSGKQYAILRIAVTNSNPEFLDMMNEHVLEHNQSVLIDHFPNAGFDLFVPNETVLPKNQFHKSTLVSLDIKCEMMNSDNSPSGFFMFPRSSISKTPLMLANHTGIIDSGYRGVLMGAFRNLDESNDYVIASNTRLLQITHPSLCPMFIEIVNEDNLSDTTRGEGGFGSTGI
jgi:dUTP pyrophosphatase